MSKEKEKQLQKLILKYKTALQKVESKEGTELENFKHQIIKEGCFHPEYYLRHRTQRYDDGYGKWWTIKIKECGLCKQQLEVDYPK